MTYEEAIRQALIERGIPEWQLDEMMSRLKTDKRIAQLMKGHHWDEELPEFSVEDFVQWSFERLLRSRDSNEHIPYQSA